MDLDLSKHIFDEILVERDGYAFYVAIIYEKLSDYCNICQTIGHFDHACNKLHPLVDQEMKSKDDKVKKPIMVAKSITLF